VTLEHEGAQLSATLFSANSESDRCILRAEAPLPKWVKVRPFADVKVGERAFSIGAPQGYELTIAEGIVSSKRAIEGDRLLQTSAPISPGSSGGGLFDAQGNLLGITTWMRKDAQNLNFAIAAEEYAK
jgi:S1-C subfamily serine protease